MIFGKILGLLGLTMLFAFPAWAQELLSESTDLVESDMEMNEDEMTESTQTELEDDEHYRRKYNVWRYKLAFRNRSWTRTIVVCSRLRPLGPRHPPMTHHHHHHHHYHYDLAEDTELTGEEENEVEEEDSERTWYFHNLKCWHKRVTYPYKQYYLKRYRSFYYYWA